MAEALFRDGVALFDAGRIHEACAKFAESYRLDPANGTLQDEALCHAREGKTASAWAEFALLAGRAAQAGQKERERMARAQVEELEKRLARVTLAIDGATNVAQVIVDGEELGRAAWSTPLPLDPGTHAFVFRAPGKREATRTLLVPRGAATLRLEVPSLADDAAPPPPPEPPRAAIPAEPPAVPPPERSSAQRTIGQLAVAGGVALVGVGTYFGLRTLAQKDDAEAHCAGRYCDPQGLASSDGAHTSATWSTITFGAGLAAVTAGAWLWLTAPDDSPGASARVVPAIAPRTAGAAIEGHF